MHVRVKYRYADISVLTRVTRSHESERETCAPRARPRAHCSLMVSSLIVVLSLLRDFLCEISSRNYPERYLLHLYLHRLPASTRVRATRVRLRAKTRTSTRYFTRSLCTHRVSLHRLATTCADGADPLGSRRGSRTQPGPRGRARPYWPARRAALSCSPSPSGAPT